MSSKRPAILMGTLLLLLLGYFVQQHSLTQFHMPPEAPPLPGKSSVSNLQVHQDGMGSWTADFDYFYTGQPHLSVAVVEVAPLKDASNGKGADTLGFPQHATFVPTPQRGSHHVSVALSYPGAEQTTRTVAVRFLDARHRAVFATQQVDQTIDWPTFQGFYENQQLSGKTPGQNLRHAQDLIDTQNLAAIAGAKTLLEKLLRQNSRLDPAYVELARVAMKTDGGAQGFHQAETLLFSALEIRHDSADAKILLGYVYAHQNRFAEAEKLFTEAAASNPPNAWLWENWGDMLTLQHKDDQAIVKYREAIARPITHDSHDRGRKAAYHELLALLGRRKDLDAMEVLFKHQIADYGTGSCYSTDYARFMLQIRGDTQGAIDLARRALNEDCEDSPAREVLGLAEYVKWAATTGPERVESLNEARIYLPAGPKPLYLLTTSDRTTPAARQLIASGERIDQKDSRGQTALLYALENADLAAARRLLTLHARPDTPVGPTDVPLALIPVMEGNLPAIRLLREFGADYSKLLFQGSTAVQYAKQAHNRELLEALGDSGTTL